MFGYLSQTSGRLARTVVTQYPRRKPLQDVYEINYRKTVCVCVDTSRRSGVVVLPMAFGPEADS